MSKVVIDIETLGFPFDSFDEPQQEYLLKFAGTDAEREEAIQKLSLYPMTARIIAIGMLNPETNRGKVFYQAEAAGEDATEDGAVRLIATDERTMLEHFWKDMTHFPQFVTFNGRGFDCPFLMLRSALLGVKPSRSLVPYRYDGTTHCDLLEQFTFYGIVRKFNLDFYCKAFGIDSPKSHGITGLDMKELFEAKRFRDIAEYNLRDLRATAELFRRWETYLKFA
jgi:hypothetical protein